MRTLALCLLLLAALVPAAEARVSDAEQARAAPRILYASDWSGTNQLYAVDPTGTRAHGQLTFGRAPACVPGHPCGYHKPAASPDGRRVLFWDFVAQGPRVSRLFVARADGSGRRQLAQITSFFAGEAAWAPDSRRIAYAGDKGVYVVDVVSSRRRLVYSTGGADFYDRLRWSPDGGELAILHQRSLVVVRGAARTFIARPVDDVAWSPKGDRLAYLAKGLFLVRPDGKGRRRLVTSAQRFPYDLEWSPTGRWLAYAESNGVRIVTVATRATRNLQDARCCVGWAWSPGGRLLAYDVAESGVTVVDAANGRTTRLSPDHAVALEWAPDGRSLAYLQIGDGFFPTRDLRVVTLAGRVRTVVEAEGDYGGRMTSFTWTRPAAGTRYVRPAARRLATVRGNELVASSSIQRLAADEGRVAYISCGRVFTWTPSTGAVIQAEAVASMSPRCSNESYFDLRRPFTLALAGDRVVHGWGGGGNAVTFWLGGVTLGSELEEFTLGGGSMTRGGSAAAFGSLVGDPVGQEDLLIFSTWNRRGSGGRPCCFVAEQALLRAEPAGCPCPEIAVEPGPFVPFDVDDGRIAAGGDNELVLLDRAGARLLAVPVRALAAQLSGNDLVVLVQGQLRRYDASSGALVSTWALPDVPSGTECNAPGARTCPQLRLLLQDAARGLVTYVLDGQVHVLRLSDGADTIVAPGTLARFTDTGLVYASGSRLLLVP